MTNLIIMVVIGLAIVILTIVDIVWTTLWVEGGAGFITDNLSKGTWFVMTKISGNNRKILRLTGPLLLIGTLFMWVVLLWFGWFLVFSASPQAIMNTSNPQAISWHNVMYYSGYTLFTLGLGDYSPGGPYWQLLTALASGTGMLFFTFGASYIISIVGAVVDKRSFSSSISEIGKSSEEIIKAAWNGKDFSDIDLLLMNLSDNLSKVAVKHKAYPLLHYYHTSDKEKTMSLTVPTIDDALSILAYGIEDRAKPNGILLKKFRNGVKDYLDVLEETYMTKANDPLKLPDLTKLRKAGYPVVADDVFEKNMKGHEERRQQLLGFVLKDNWKEEDIVTSK
ncbi:potassium channel family protein [Alkalibacterium kapii]|uniref:Putative membrane protein YdjJ n=1 Tax=Alkalibacterium kapii TaxID=426704 RepID=A0A511AS97_9LACT|nr:potassium channel family protein [Alkalibacterium kapii]GEK91068.1 putative membrane protein YdjJ [Alkalibacterium kapii]